MDIEFLAGLSILIQLMHYSNFKGGKIIVDPEFDKKILNESLVMSFSYFREICVTMNEQFSLGKAEELRNLGKRQKSFKRG